MGEFRRVVTRVGQGCGRLAGWHCWAGLWLMTAQRWWTPGLPVPWR